MNLLSIVIAEAQRMSGELAKAQGGWDARAEEYDVRIATLQVCSFIHGTAQGTVACGIGRIIIDGCGSE